MEGRGGGSSTPSYIHVVANKSEEVGSNRFKRPMEVETERISTEKPENISSHDQEENHEEVREEKRTWGSSQRAKHKSVTGLCKPRSAIKPRVVLNNPALQELRDHMMEYAIICKFMGIWPMEKALQVWIRNQCKPKGEITLHLGSKGFFTMVFTNLEDKDRVFEGGPYFYAVDGLYMRPWVMNFVLERETFTSVPVWIRLYSLPLDYWLPESLKAIGNKLGHFLKISKATLWGKYTSFARICVEMDLSGALPDEIILEVYDEEWV